MPDRLARLLLLAATLVAAAGVLLIALFVLLEGAPALSALLGTLWSPEEGRYGVLPLLAGSAAVTLLALLLVVPVALGVALFLTEVAPPALVAVARPLLQSLAGVPSVVYGFVGMGLLVPAIRTGLGGPGFSLLAAALVLAVMILPTIAAVAADGLGALPPTYREGAYALGASPGQVVWRVLLPAARSTLFTAVALGLGRALGETMAVLMVSGNVPLTPTSPLDPVRTLTATIALEMGYATGAHREALFGAGVLLLALVLVVNGLVRRQSG